jgi:hypothetical protein
LILLAEEEATTITEVERLLKQALKCAENAYRKSQQLLEQGHNQDIVHSKNTNMRALLVISRSSSRTQYEYINLCQTTSWNVREKIGQIA